MVLCGPILGSKFSRGTLLLCGLKLWTLVAVKFLVQLLVFVVITLGLGLNLSSEVAWVVPTFPPDFGYYKQFLRSFSDLSDGIDPVVVLTDDEEADLFRREVGTVQQLILSDYFAPHDIDFFLATRSIINVKKLLALQQLRTQYERLIVTDSEVEIYAPIDSQLIMTHRPRIRFQPLTNPSYHRIIAAPIGLLAEDDERKTLSEKLLPSMLYGWFSDLPIYDANRLPAFFTRFEIAEASDLRKITFEHFDHLLYQYHLVLDGEEYDVLAHLADLELGGTIWELGYLATICCSALCSVGC